MRYKIDENGDIIVPADQLSHNASDSMLLVTSGLGVLIAIALFVLGRKGKQLYMWTWGIGLGVLSVYLALAIAFDLRLMGLF